jgi:hypothetical protein
MPVFYPSDLVCEAMVMDPTKDVYRSRLRTVRSFEDDDGEIDDYPTPEALIDRDANCGFAGADPRKTCRHVDGRGIGGPGRRVREAITDEIIAFYHDALSILWVYHQVWKLLRPLLF